MFQLATDEGIKVSGNLQKMKIKLPHCYKNNLKAIKKADIQPSRYSAYLT
jgi:phage-related holin